MNNDLISRSALLEEIEEDIEWVIAQMSATTAISALKIAMRRIKKAPAVDAEPVRHGEWLLNMEYDRQVFPTEKVFVGFKCSLCGRKVRSKKEPYCHCGAKMDVEVQHE